MPAVSRHEPRRRARRRALQALYQWQLNPREVNDILRQFFEEQDFGNVDVQWFELLLRGVARTGDELDRQLAEFLDRPGEHLDVIERVILQIGAWELLNQPEVPFRVVLDEAIDLARRFGAEQGHSYINAVLDKAAQRWRPLEYRGESPSA